MLKHFVLLLLVPVLLVSCQDREREKTMAEIERLDLLRKKINEFLPGQKASLLSKKLEYANWKSGHLANLTKYQKVIAEAEKEKVDTGKSSDETGGAKRLKTNQERQFYLSDFVG